MNSNRNLWPLGILLAFVIFISGTVALIVIACSNNSDLVSADYYEEEILYQAELDGLKRAQALTTAVPVTYDAAAKRILIVLPGGADGASDGVIQLYRPSGAAMDRVIPLAPGADGIQAIDAAQLQPGLWKVKVIWKLAGVDLRLNEKVIVSAERS